MPAAPLVVAAMNPCPCGYAGDGQRICRCGPDQAQRYRNRVSGPLLDRFDLHVQLNRVPVRALKQAPTGDRSAVVKERILEARQRDQERKKRQGHAQSLDRLAAELEPQALDLLHRAIEQLGLSLRAYNKVLRVSRTIADLDAQDKVRVKHVAEAVQYRLLDREEPNANAKKPQLRRTTPSA